MAEKQEPRHPPMGRRRVKRSDVHGPSQVRSRVVPGLVANVSRLLG